MKKTCLACGQSEFVPIASFGPQPVCNRFLKNKTDPESLYPLTLRQCAACGLVQLAELIPAEELKPGYDWITYREPERHLDHLAVILASLPELSKSSVIWGLSFKDDTLLARLGKLGFTATWRMDPMNDLGVEWWVGVETIQDRITPDTAKRLEDARKEKPFVLLARHMLEHAHNPLVFLGALREMLGENGCALFEVPDCTRALEKCDCTMLWEEHTMYFTPTTYLNTLARGGFEVFRYEVAPYSLENSLICLARPAKPKPAFPGQETLARQLALAKGFGNGFPEQRERIRSYFSEFTRNKGGIAIYGGGHLAAAYINLLGIESMVSLVVDDNWRKWGLLMPGSKLPIVASKELLGSRVKLCLMCLNTEMEQKVVSANARFVAGGGKFASVFPDSPFYLKI